MEGTRQNLQSPEFKLIAAPYTPFTKDNEVDEKQLQLYVKSLAQNGLLSISKKENEGATKIVPGVFINGTTGEGTSLTVLERKNLLELWIKLIEEQEDLGKVYVFAHVGANNLDDAIELTRHACSLPRVDAVASVAPYYFPITDVKQLVEGVAKIASAAGNLPFYYYHIPQLTKADVSIHQFLVEAEEKIENLVGVKYSGKDMFDFQRAAMYKERKYELLFGSDEFLLAGLSLGATGAVGSTYSIPHLIPHYLRVIHSFDCGDLKAALDHQNVCAAVVKVMLGSGSFFSLLKFVCGSSPHVRFPHAELSTDGLEYLVGKLNALWLDS